jgi:hypothetical protein
VEEHLTAFLPGTEHPRALLFAHTSRRKSGLLSAKLGSHTLNLDMDWTPHGARSRI